MKCKSPKTSEHPQKPRHRPRHSPALYQIQSAVAKLLVSFRCQVNIREGQAGSAHDMSCSKMSKECPVYPWPKLLYGDSLACTIWPPASANPHEEAVEYSMTAMRADLVRSCSLCPQRPWSKLKSLNHIEQWACRVLEQITSICSPNENELERLTSSFLIWSAACSSRSSF